MKYKVQIEETLSKTVEIEATTPEEAYTKAHEMYKNSDIVLSADDFIDMKIQVLNA